MRHIYCYFTLNFPLKDNYKLWDHITDDINITMSNAVRATSDIDTELIMHLGQNSHDVS